MDDRLIMETLLSNVKGACDLMMHGSIESPTPNVRSTFTSTLNDTLAIQNQIYSKMEAKGWYVTECAEKQKIDQAKQKFAAN